MLTGLRASTENKTHYILWNEVNQILDLVLVMIATKRLMPDNGQLSLETKRQNTNSFLERRFMI